MDSQCQQAVSHYTHTYQLLYERTPRDIHFLGDDWVSINGAQMHISELEFLTQQLRLEYDKLLRSQRRTLVQRLLTWFKQ